MAARRVAHLTTGYGEVGLPPRKPGVYEVCFTLMSLCTLRGYLYAMSWLGLVY